MIQRFGKGDTPQRLPVSKGRSTLLRAMLLELEVGESLLLSRADWKTKSPPSYVVVNIKCSQGYADRILPCALEWVFIGRTTMDSS